MNNNNETPPQSLDSSKFKSDNTYRSNQSSVPLRTPPGYLNNGQGTLPNRNRREHVQRQYQNSFRKVDESLSSIHSNLVEDGKTLEERCSALESRLTRLINLANLFSFSQLPPGTEIPKFHKESSSLRDDAQELRNRAVNLQKNSFLSRSDYQKLKKEKEVLQEEIERLHKSADAIEQMYCFSWSDDILLRHVYHKGIIHRTDVFSKRLSHGWDAYTSSNLYKVRYKLHEEDIRRIEKENPGYKCNRYYIEGRSYHGPQDGRYVNYPDGPKLMIEEKDLDLISVPLFNITGPTAPLLTETDKPVRPSYNQRWVEKRIQPQLLVIWDVTLKRGKGV